MRPPVAPYLTVSPAMAAIAFYASVFGARQKAIMPALDGMRIMHCELEINGGSVMLADAFPEFGQTRMPLPGELATASVS
jgi:PhnB protein